MEHDIQILSGKVSRDDIHVWISYHPHQQVSKIVQWLKGTSSRVLLQEFPHLRKELWVDMFGPEGTWPSALEPLRIKWSRSTLRNKKENSSTMIVNLL